MLKIKYIVIFSFLMLSPILLVMGQSLPTLQELKQSVSLEIPGAMVSQAKEAYDIGIKAYFKKGDGLLAKENLVPTSIITLGYDIPRFAKSGDKIWELRALSWGTDNTQHLRGILWVHSETSDVYFSSGTWDITKIVSSDKIENAKVCSQDDAKRIASDAYLKKMQLNVSATESVQDISIIKLGYNVKDFVSKGQKLWEVRIKTIEDELISIIWINPYTEKVRFVSGPWESGEIKKTKEKDSQQKDMDPNKSPNKERE